MASADSLLTVEGLSKNYQEVVAIEDIAFELERNSILGIIGDNGAGKSTLLSILNGYVKPDAGSMVLNGEAYAPTNPQDAREAGVAMTYEDFALVDGAPVWENFFMGREAGTSYGPLKTIDQTRMRSEVAEKLDEYGFDFGVDKHSSELSGGQRRILVVSRAIESQPDLLLLDEPFRGLSERAINQLRGILREFSEDGSVIITSQWYSALGDEIDDVMVFRQGENVGKFSTDNITRKEGNRLVMEGSA